jgi:hypothetical protein
VTRSGAGSGFKILSVQLGGRGRTQRDLPRTDEKIAAIQRADVIDRHHETNAAIRLLRRLQDTGQLLPAA